MRSNLTGSFYWCFLEQKNFEKKIFLSKLLLPKKPPPPNLGRKILVEPEDEQFPEGAYHFLIPEYSYWTLAYALSLEGAKKLMAQAPLDRLVPVDEYLPIMYDKHNRVELLEHFGPRDLRSGVNRNCALSFHFKISNEKRAVV